MRLMSDSITVKIPKSVLKTLESEAKRVGLGIEEYIIDLILREADPAERSSKYIEASRSLLLEAREELSKGNIRQAAEKVWGVAALAIKAHAEAVRGRRLTSHADLWEYSEVVENDLGSWVYDAWMAANGMHTCFYEGWCTKRKVEEAIKRVERLVNEIFKVIKELTH